MMPGLARANFSRAYNCGVQTHCASAGVPAEKDVLHDTNCRDRWKVSAAVIAAMAMARALPLLLRLEQAVPWMGLASAILMGGSACPSVAITWWSRGGPIRSRAGRPPSRPLEMQSSSVAA